MRNNKTPFLSAIFTASIRGYQRFFRLSPLQAAGFTPLVPTTLCGCSVLKAL